MLPALSLIGQTPTNPFDLTFRSPKPPVINPRVDPVPLPDTLLTIKPPVNQDTGTQSGIVADIETRTDTNPFDLGKSTGPDSGNPVIDQNSKENTERIQDIVSGVTKKPSRGIQIFFLLLSLLFLIFIVNVERSFVKDLWRVISNENYSSLHLRNQRNTMRQILLFMGYSVFIIQAGIFLYHSMSIFGYRGTLLDNVWICMALVMVVYLVRHSVIGYLRWLFNNEKEMTLFSFDISIFNIMVGLVLLPINVMLNFGPESLTKPLIIIGIIVAAVAYLMRQLRWFFTARQLITNSLFLFFVYLCAVEILPLWAISKYFW